MAALSGPLRVAVDHNAVYRRERRGRNSDTLPLQSGVWRSIASPMSVLESVHKLWQSTAGEEVLVPLTASMHVPGPLVDLEHVLVAVGTDYSLEKTTEGAREYFKRRIKFVTDQMKKLQTIGTEKQRMRDALEETPHTKVQRMAAQQQVAAQTAAA